MEKEIMPVFQLLRLIRDARSTKNADRELLYALAMRCQPAKMFVCWPSYRQLALDTMLDEVTLKRAAKHLEDAKLISRVVRANRSNRFFINVPLLQQQVAEVKVADDAAKNQEPDVDSPFDQPVISEAEAETDEDELASWNVTGGAR
jgi:DNA-binding transcriptional MocR family regulator